MPVYALIGYPLSHSFSKTYFTHKFQELSLGDYEYMNLELKNLEALEAILSGIELSGFNVTIPYKESILPFLDFISPDAEKIAAVNTVRINKDGKLEGFNTDHIGFKSSLLPLLQPHHQSALILGSGGASKAVAFVLDELNIPYHFVSRSTSGKGFLTYDSLNDSIIEQSNLLINTTPLGMFPDIHSFPPIPYSAINHRHLLYDLVYNPAETAFMKKGLEKGATVVNGASMLALQAEAAWKIWQDKN